MSTRPNQSPRSRGAPAEVTGPAVVVSPPGFAPQNGPGPGPTTMTDEWPTESLDPEWVDAGDGDGSGVPPPTGDAGPSRGSTDDPSLAGAVFGIVAQAIVLAGVGVHAWRTPGPDNAAWMMTEADAHGIGEPLSRIIARHVPLGDGKATDISDGIEAAMAATAYVATGLSDEKPIRNAAKADAGAAA